MLVQWVIDGMYSVINIRDVQSTNPIEGNSYKAKYQSDYLDAIVIAIGSRVDCNKEMKMRTSSKPTTSKEKPCKKAKICEPVKTNSENEKLNILKTECTILKSKNDELEKMLHNELNISAELRLKLSAANKQIEMYKQTFSKLSNIYFFIEFVMLISIKVLRTNQNF